MARWCPNCGRSLDEGEKFCRQCGMPQHLDGEDAKTWILSPEPASESKRPTTPVKPQQTAPANPPNMGYTPPPQYYAPSPQPPAPYQQIAQPGQAPISLGDWLSGGWQVYKENWAIMSVASGIAIGLSFATAGILAGPLLMGLYQQAFKTMRGEVPTMGDLFHWRGRFLQAFLTALTFGGIYLGLGGIGNQHPFFGLLSAAATPLLTVMLSFTMSLVVDREID